MKYFISLPFIILVIVFLISPTQVQALPCAKPGCNACPSCPGLIKGCQTHCVCVSNEETGKPDNPKTTLGHVTDEFSKHRKWMVDLFFYDQKPNDPTGLRAAMKLMTDQLTTIGIQKVQIIGSFFDAKHQLETQRLFQELTARAHKDYHPNEQLCEIGTVTRSLAASNRNSDLTSTALSRRATERHLMAKDTTSTNGVESDQDSRLVNFIKKYCDPNDNAGNLDLLCTKSEKNRKLYNKDVNYTTTIETPLTLDIDFSSKDPDNTDDENALFALTANLLSHKPFINRPSNVFVKDDQTPDYDGAGKVYLDARALTAKRSVAANSLAAIAGLKSKGDEQAQPFLYALIKEMGGDKITVDDIKRTIGEQPSYYAQMEILTKKLYQNPQFYADLYDKPANVLRKDVAIQAATLMQKRDLYRSYLRSEMILATMLETALSKEQERLSNETNAATERGKGRELGN